MQGLLLTAVCLWAVPAAEQDVVRDIQRAFRPSRDSESVQAVREQALAAAGPTSDWGCLVHSFWVSTRGSPTSLIKHTHTHTHSHSHKPADRGGAQHAGS